MTYRGKRRDSAAEAPGLFRTKPLPLPRIPYPKLFIRHEGDCDRPFWRKGFNTRGIHWLQAKYVLFRGQDPSSTPLQPVHRVPDRPTWGWHYAFDAATDSKLSAASARARRLRQPKGQA
jgi:hypothetical protein